MTPAKPIKVLYCENNVDGTIGGSYYSLLYLVKGLDRASFDPTVVFYTEHSLLPAFHEAGIRTIIWPRPAGINLARHCAVPGAPAHAAPPRAAGAQPAPVRAVESLARLVSPHPRDPGRAPEQLDALQPRLDAGGPAGADAVPDPRARHQRRYPEPAKILGAGWTQ